LTPGESVKLTIIKKHLQNKSARCFLIFGSIINVGVRKQEK